MISRTSIDANGLRSTPQGANAAALSRVFRLDADTLVLPPPPIFLPA